MLGLIRNEGSLRVWYDGGRLINHSVAGARAVWLITLRWEEKASHSIMMNRSRATKEIREPIDEIIFHLVNESG